MGEDLSVREGLDHNDNKSAYLNFSNGKQLFEIITFTVTQVTTVVVHGICDYIELMSEVNGKADVNINTCTSALEYLCGRESLFEERLIMREYI